MGRHVTNTPPPWVLHLLCTTPPSPHPPPSPHALNAATSLYSTLDNLHGIPDTL